MFFRNIIGQDDIKQKLIANARTGHLPHAMLFSGPEGVGKMPMALALARYLCCRQPGADDACGHCPSCIQFDKLQHPDLHFAFPVYKRKAGTEPISADYLNEWRTSLLKQPYITLEQWYEDLGLDNQQPQFYASQSDEIQRELSLKSSQGGYKVMIIWLPEKMNAAAANKLLKLIEEPPELTLFLLLTDAEEDILPTILSRTQQIRFRPLSERQLSEFLCADYHLTPDDAQLIAHRADGSVAKAVRQLSVNNDEQRCFESFVSLMRLAWMRDIKKLKEWSEKEAGSGREAQKVLLNYYMYMLRENFMNNFRRSELVFMNKQEQQFAARFSPYIREQNILGLTECFSTAIAHIEQNVNPKMVFFDMALQVIMLLKTK